MEHIYKNMMLPLIRWRLPYAHNMPSRNICKHRYFITHDICKHRYSSRMILVSAATCKRRIIVCKYNYNVLGEGEAAAQRLALPGGGSELAAWEQIRWYN